LLENSWNRSRSWTLFSTFFFSTKWNFISISINSIKKKEKFFFFFFPSFEWVNLKLYYLDVVVAFSGFKHTNSEYNLEMKISLAQMVEKLGGKY